MQSTLSHAIRSRSLPLATVVRAVRGESSRDPRPNKALDPDAYRLLLNGYEHQRLLITIAINGFKVDWSRERPRQRARPQNHKSAVKLGTAVDERIAEGVAAGTYLLLDLDILEACDIHVSPFGAVPKADGSSDFRLIHDLSYPPAASVNDYTLETSLPSIVYASVSRLAERIEETARLHPDVRTLMLKGDVNAAFRHLRQSADDVRWMGGLLPSGRAAVVDLSAPFGWTGSPALYGAFGRAISFIVASESPSSMHEASSDTQRFFAYEWVDDHIMIEPDIADRCAVAEDVLRLAMLAILGPTAINEAKFSGWSTKLRALGLDWDTTTRTVAIPREKIAKALTRLADVRSAVRVPVRTLQQLLGSLRHVATCLRSARPFYQRLHAACARCPRHGSVSLSAWMRDDLAWFDTILRLDTFHAVPTRLFGSLPDPNVHIYCDASDVGLCVLDPAHRRYIALDFDAEERQLIADRASGFDINVREHLAIAIACMCFGALWQAEALSQWLHIRVWTDNMTAQARTNKLAASNELAQELTRAVGFAEASFRLCVSARHLPGAINRVADAGSRQRPVAHSPDLLHVLAELQASSLAPSSRQLYDRSWSQWCAWRQRHGASPRLPADQLEQSQALAVFAVACWLGAATRARNAPATILSKLSHISWAHQLHYGYPVGLSAAHKLAMLGMRRLSPPATRRAPITVVILRQLRRNLDRTKPTDRVIWGAAVLGYFFLLRRSEYLAVGGAEQWFIIRRYDVKLTNERHETVVNPRHATRVTIRLRGSKTDQGGESTTRTLTKATERWLCPVRAARALLTEGDDELKESPLCAVRGRALTSQTLDRALKNAAASLGLDPSQYSTHSLRSGGATAMFKAGLGDSAIKLQGRWKSDCYQRYIHMDAATLEQASDMMAR